MFLLLGLVLAASVAAGFALGGRPARLRGLRVHGLGALPLALVLGLVPLFADLGPWADRALVAAANLVVAAVLVANLGAHRGAVRAGFAILLLGWLLNAAPILANGGMPLSLWAYREAGVTEAVTPGEGGFFKIVIAGEGTRLRALGDVVPIRPLSQVVSLGDIALALGVGVVVAGGMRGATGAAQARVRS